MRKPETCRSRPWARLHSLVRSWVRVFRGGTPAPPEPAPPEPITPYSLWVATEGHRTLRFDYELGPDSVVLDVGGYDGQWASDIFARYCCRVHVLEPSPEYARMIRDRFAANPAIEVHPFGLAGKTRTARLALAGDGSSILRDAPETVEVRLVSAEEFFRSQGLDRVHLMKINIEGAEYELLDHMLDAGLIPRIRDIQIQFHRMDESSAGRRAAIQARLRQTHDPTYQVEWAWENWRRRKGPDGPAADPACPT